MGAKFDDKMKVFGMKLGGASVEAVTLPEEIRKFEG